MELKIGVITSSRLCWSRRVDSEFRIIEDIMYRTRMIRVRYDRLRLRVELRSEERREHKTATKGPDEMKQIQLQKKS